MESALLDSRGPCGLPAPGRCRQRDALENKEAGQGMPRLLPLQGLQELSPGHWRRSRRPRWAAGVAGGCTWPAIGGYLAPGGRPAARVSAPVERHCLPLALPVPPRSTSSPGTLTPPLTVRARPGTPVGFGPAASCRAGRGPRTGGPSGGRISGTTGSSILSVRPSRGARTVAWDKTTYQMGGRKRGPGTVS